MSQRGPFNQNMSGTAANTETSREKTKKKDFRVNIYFTEICFKGYRTFCQSSEKS